MQKLLKEASTDLSLADLLDKGDVSETEYVEALQTSCSGSVVVLKPELGECCTNNYNPAVMLTWQANMVRFVLNAYACVMYVASNIMKTERAMGDQVAAEARMDELKTQLRKVGSAFLTHRESECTRTCVSHTVLTYERVEQMCCFCQYQPQT